MPNPLRRSNEPLATRHADCVSAGPLLRIKRNTIGSAPAVEELSNWLPSTLPTRAGAGADASLIADTLFYLLLDINGALAPSIGQPSVTLLFQRSLGQIASAHPWVAETLGSTNADLDITALSTVLALQSTADAAAGGYAFLEAFYELLVGLVGLSLTERLLRSVWANHSTEPRV